jgi:hypothetical protein
MNSYAIWQVVLAIKPPLIIESGVHQGWTSWLLRHASNKYGGATIVRMDPSDGGPKAWQDKDAASKSVNMRGKNFVDFNRVNWAQRYTADVLSRALVFFDDHQDQVIIAATSDLRSAAKAGEVLDGFMVVVSAASPAGRLFTRFPFPN